MLMAGKCYLEKTLPHAAVNDTIPPVETKPPNTNYKPAVEGQTRIAGVKTVGPYEGVILTTTLRRPWSVAVLPDGRLIITQKYGTMRIINTDGKGGIQSLACLPLTPLSRAGSLVLQSTRPSIQTG